MKDLNEIKVVCIGDATLLRDITIEDISDHRIKVSFTLESKYIDCNMWADTTFRLQDSENTKRHAYVVLTTNDSVDAESHYDYPSLGDFIVYDTRGGDTHTWILEDWNAPGYNITPSIKFKPHPI